jgi:hypothetical protein
LRQLSKKSVNRTIGSYAYLAALAALATLANVLAWRYDTSHPDAVATVVFLAVGAAT